MVVALICGGGNGAHAASAVAASQEGVEARVLSLYGDEAARWTRAMEERGFCVTQRQSEGSEEEVRLTTQPSLVTNDPALAMPGVDIIVFMVPAFAHAQYLTALKPFVKPGMALAGCPGQAGFEFAVRGVWGELARQVSYMSFESLPWACRISTYGEAAEILGTKESLVGAVLPSDPPPSRDPVGLLQQVLGPAPRLISRGHLLGITLMEVNGVVHPSITHGLWSKWDGRPLPEPPLFYQGIDEDAADVMSGMSQEVVDTARAIMRARPGADLTSIQHIFPWYLACYSKQMADTSTLYAAIRSNAPYVGLTHPCVRTPEGTYTPDFRHRYMAEDIPFGLVVIRGIAEVAEVATPTIDMVLTWSQQQMGKEYLLDGKVAGKDIGETRAPQAYGLTTIDQILG